MAVVRLRDHYDPAFKEFIVGPKQVPSRGTYLVMGEMEAGEIRRLAPGRGHEEILTLIAGSGEVHAGGEVFPLSPGDALHLGPDFSGELRASPEASLRYISAGGHVPGGHGH